MSTSTAISSTLASSISSTSTTSLSAAVPANMQINESDFLQLISTQLENQDPLQPTDPSQFLGQLEGLSEVSSLQSVQTAMASSQMTTGANLIGHSVLATGTSAALTSDGTLSGAVTAPTGATSLTVSIANSSGSKVASFQVTPASSGMTSFSWNGTTSSGTTAAAGQYTVSVTANVKGTATTVSPMVVNPVQSVTLDSSTQQLDVNTSGGTVALSSVVSVL